MAEVIGVAGIVLAAVLTYSLGLRQDRRSRISQELIEATTEFCRSLMTYRASQLERRHHALAGGPEDGEVVRQVRSTRASVWTAYFRVVLVADDAEAAVRCRRALESAQGIQDAATPDQTEAIGEQVRVEAEHFVRRVAEKLGVSAASLE